jgi:P-type E1-E2 ATPase
MTVTAWTIPVTSRCSDHVTTPGQSGFSASGGIVLADGVVEQGESDVNEAMITGESKPIRKESVANVIAGTINGAGSLSVKVTATGGFEPHNLSRAARFRPKHHVAPLLLKSAG